MGSSRSSSGASLSCARANASLVRCPADSPNPSSPNGVSNPWRSANADQSPTVRNASWQAESLASGAPNRTTSATGPGSTRGRWVARCARLARIEPDVGVRIPAIRSNRVLLPLPDGPVSTVKPTSAEVSRLSRLRMWG